MTPGPFDAATDNLPSTVASARHKARSWNESAGSMDNYFDRLVGIDERVQRLRDKLDLQPSRRN